MSTLCYVNMYHKIAFFSEITLQCANTVFACLVTFSPFCLSLSFPPSLSLSPVQKTSTPDSLCTHITDIPTVLSSLKDFDKWNKLSIELRIAGSESGAKNGDSVSVLERWFEKKESVCWETLIAALQTLGYGGLADQVAQKYLPN